MATEVVMVNGLPGSGKSTLCKQLADRLQAPGISKDRVREILADVLGNHTVDGNIGAVAMETVWALAGEISGLVVVESWWFRPRDLEYVRNGLETVGAGSVVEVWCDVPLEIARQRYSARKRHEVHRDDRDMTAEWSAWAADGIPLGIGPVVHVNTAMPVDVDSLVDRVLTLLRLHAARAGGRAINEPERLAGVTTSRDTTPKAVTDQAAPGSNWRRAT